MKDQIWQLILEERKRQDKIWGGENHDDCHVPGDWFRYIEHQTAKGWTGARSSFKKSMIKIAALAVAAIESNERLIKANLEDGTTKTRAAKIGTSICIHGTPTDEKCLLCDS